MAEAAATTSLSLLLLAIVTDWPSGLEQIRIPANTSCGAWMRRCGIDGDELTQTKAHEILIALTRHHV